MWWLLISALALLALWSLWEQRRNDRETEQALFELGRRVTRLEQGKPQTLLPPPPEVRPPPFPLPPVPEMPMQSKLTRAMTRVWRRG